LTTIQKITLTSFRNYASASFDFGAPVSCITGPNGSGKTNLLDAVYYLCYTKSYFSAYQQHSVRHGDAGFRLEGLFEKNGRQSLIACKWKDGKKEVSASGVPYERISDHIGSFAAVMIAPDDMELINDGSEIRRRWMDGILGQTNRRYLESLMHYQRVLQQRNAWLKQQAFNPSADRLALEYYDDQLSVHGAWLYECRNAVLEQFSPLLNTFYHQISGGRETIELRYASDLHRQPLALWLREGLQQDLRMQRTTRGLHKDDWVFTIDGIPVRQFASQGQKKSFLFALKLAQYAYLSTALGHLPILLLDDIFEKLDQSRMEALLRIIRGPGFGQVLLTDTHAERVREAFGPEAHIGFIALGAG
jgi:DNA replication and repair protein RecF